MGQNERNAKSGTSVESCSLLLQTSLHFTTDISSAKSRVCICKHSVNEKPSPAVRRYNSFCFYGIAAAMGLRHTNGNIGVTISKARPERFSLSLPLLQFQKRFLATFANKAFEISCSTRRRMLRAAMILRNAKKKNGLHLQAVHEKDTFAGNASYCLLPVQRRHCLKRLLLHLQNYQYQNRCAATQRNVSLRYISTTSA